MARSNYPEASLAATLGVVAGAAMFGTVPLFSRALLDYGLAPAAIAFYRFAASALVLVPFLRLARSAWRDTLWAMAGGAGMGLGWIGFVTSLQSMSVAGAGVLYMTYPAFAIVIAALAFRVSPSRRGLLAAGLIVVAGLVGLPAGGFGASGAGAVLMALAAPLAYGALINILSFRLGRLPTLSAVGAIALGSVLALTPVLASLPREALVPSEVSALPWLLGFSAITALLPQFLYVIFAPRIGPVRTAVAGSMEMVAMLLVAVALGEKPSAAELLAAALIVLAVVVGAGPAGRRGGQEALASAPPPGPG